MNNVTVKTECTSCKGTGLYVGMAERNGDAVVCHTCKGTGCQTISYMPFEVRRKPPNNVLRVFQANPGIISAPGTTSGGVSLAAFEKDINAPAARGAEMRSHTCPAQWYQAADYSKKPEWEECRQALGDTFSRCPSFGDKKQCWVRFDRED